MDCRSLVDEVNSRNGATAQLVEHRTGTPLTQVRFPGAARDFFPRVNFHCRLFYGVCTPPCEIEYINICAYVKDPVVHVRLRWIMETLKHPACTVGWVARLCHSRLSQGKVSCETSKQTNKQKQTVLRVDTSISVLISNTYIVLSVKSRCCVLTSSTTSKCKLSIALGFTAEGDLHFCVRGIPP